jgi:carbon-monoxide dehydrogenase large subunit
MATVEEAPATQRPFGSSIKRREDPRLITGQGRYVDDLQLPGMVYMALLRSPHAHARLKAVRTDAAAKMPGVFAVYNGAELQGKVGTLPCGWVLPDIKMPPHPPVAIDKVRHVGDVAAVVLADTRDAARDALDAIEVDYEVLPAVADEEKALADGAPILHDDIGTNLCFTWELKGGDAEAALKSADKVVKQRIVNQRLIPNAMEPRAVVAHWVGPMEELTLWSSTQVPHLVRLLLALTAGIPEQKIRVIAPDVGGGFGSKLYLYAEEMLAACLAKLTGRRSSGPRSGAKTTSPPPTAEPRSRTSRSPAKTTGRSPA